MNENRSLRLCEILEEEYSYLHQSATSADADPTIPLYADTIDLLRENEAELLARLGKWFYPKPGEETKFPSPTELRYEKLATWLRADQEKPDSLPGEAVLSPVRIEKVLTEKLAADLVTNEPWMQDAPLRPYTRGLLQSYHQQDTLSSRVVGLFRRSFKRGQVPEAVDQKLLNRLLLEDAFTGYIQRMDDKRLANVFGRMYESGQSALCLSGGGIRSATFALGVLQGLVKHKVLDKFTYLSTVSGGGYLGGWLSAWIHHEGFEKVDKDLRGQFVTPLEPEAVPVRHLRRYSNYLSPLLGLFSPDTWTLFAIYLRNLLLLWLVIIPLLAAVTAVPWFIVTLAEFNWQGAWVGVVIMVGLSAILTVIGTGFVHAYRPRSKATYQKEQARQSSRDQLAFLQKCLLPLAAAVLCWMLAWRWLEHVPSGAPDSLIRLRESLGLDANTGLTIFSAGGWAIILGSAGVHLLGWLVSLRFQSQHQEKYRWVEPLAVLLTGGFAGFLLVLTAKLLRVGGADSNIISYTCFGVPGFLLAVVLAGYAFEGLMSQLTDDAEREWSARHSAWLLIVAVGWLAIMGLVLWGPALVNEAIAVIGLPTTAGVGAGAGVLTALLGQSSRTSGAGEGAGARKGKAGKLSLSSLLSKLTLPVVAVITVVALLLALSLLDLVLIRWLCTALSIDYPTTSILAVSSRNVSRFVSINPTVPFAVLGSLTIIGVLIGLAVNTNKFSLHALYRARLIRAYLGASRPPGERQPDPFTGFDETDNLFMGCMRPPNPLAETSPGSSPKRTPFHVINIALNLVAGRNLAWQERMAESFTVSPLHAGAMYLGYRRTYLGDTGCPDPAEDPRYYGGKRGISLGTAMTISGAAASPNHGYHSSPVVAFLMTLFNVRLGWWLGNPGPAGDKTFNQSSPSLAIKPILDEMTGNTDDVNPYVYLSDGGHFENLGLYEMVLRRNRFILVSDASCDESCTLEDLGNAIRKIRIDMGIPIEFPHGFNIRARSDTAGGPGAYWAIGRIGYSKIDPTYSLASSDGDGILLYVKPGIIGDEPRDIFNYASSKKAFPHETTADQFFSESQFESYRALGAYALERVQADLQKEFGLSLADFLTEPGWTKWLNALNKQLDKQRLKSATNGNGKLPPKLRSPIEVYINT